MSKNRYEVEENITNKNVEHSKNLDIYEGVYKKNKQEKDTYKKNLSDIIPWILLILWMGIIFYFSSQVATTSDHLSKGIVRRITEFISRGNRQLSYHELETYDNIIRKLAHFTIYFVMGLFCSNALYHLRVKKNYWILISIVICILFAISDEFHQAFVPGRGPRIFDIIVDTSGAFLGTMLYTFLKKVGHSRRKI